MLTVLVATRERRTDVATRPRGLSKTAFAAWRLEAGDRRQREHRRHARRGSSVQVIASVDVLRGASPGKESCVAHGAPRKRKATSSCFPTMTRHPIPHGSYRFGARLTSVPISTCSPARFGRAGKSGPSDGCSTTWTSLACYSITDPAQLAGPIRPALVAGPNMAIRRRVFEQGYRFDPEVGPSGGDYAMGSETDLTVRLGEAGFKVWFCPEAVVEHFIRAHQIEPKWILERAIRFGRGTYRRRLQRQVERPRLWFGVPRYLYRQIAAQALRYSWAVVFRRRGSFRERWALRRLLGCAIQARQHYSNPTRPLPRQGRSAASLE